MFIFERPGRAVAAAIAVPLLLLLLDHLCHADDGGGAPLPQVTAATAAPAGAAGQACACVTPPSWSIVRAGS